MMSIPLGYLICLVSGGEMWPRAKDLITEAAVQVKTEEAKQNPDTTEQTVVP